MAAKKAVLIIDSTGANPDLLYATGGFSVPDPVIFFKNGSETALVLSNLELERGRKEAAVSSVLPLSRYADGMRGRRFSLADVAFKALKERKISHVEVQSGFPVAFADVLRRKGVKISCSGGPVLFEERLKKKPFEVSLIRKSLKDTADAMRTAGAMIASAESGKGGVLRLGGKILTSERIKRAVNSFLAARGYSVSGTIVACGAHSAMPHHSGAGPVFAGRPVVVDIFPRSEDGYFGDMTRTFVKGAPPPVLARMYKTVLQGQKVAFSKIRHGAKAREIHGAVTDYFNSQGFETRLGDSPRGFIHSTGHGLGMELHEPPGLGANDAVLETGNVVTVEPGLYYPETGGVRIEDVVLVTKTGCTNLTVCSKRFEVAGG